MAVLVHTEPERRQRPRDPARPRHVVAFAASAGGISALTQILEALPASLAATVLVVQHLAPRYRSWLAEILQRRVRLVVRQARDGDLMKPGVIFIAPPNRHLIAGADGVLTLSDAVPVHHVRPSADLLFASLAASVGQAAIAVVLTGTGTDGADGVRAIKRSGGTVLVQDEASAQFTGMPAAAIRTGAADQVLPLGKIARAITQLVAS